MNELQGLGEKREKQNEKKKKKHEKNQKNMNCLALLADSVDSSSKQLSDPCRILQLHRSKLDNQSDLPATELERVPRSGQNE